MSLKEAVGGKNMWPWVVLNLPFFSADHRQLTNDQWVTRALSGSANLVALSKPLSSKQLSANQQFQHPFERTLLC